MKSIIRFFTALFLAVSATFFLFAGFWFYSLYKAEKRLHSTAENLFGGSVVFKQVEWNPNPFEVDFTVHDVQVNFASTKSPAKVRAAFEKVRIRHDLYGEFKLKVELPQVQVVELSYGDKVYNYEVLLEGGTLMLYPSYGSDELFVSARGASVREIMPQGERKPFIDTSDIYLMSSTGIVDPSSGVRLNINNLRLWQKGEQKHPLNAVLVDVNPHDWPSMISDWILPTIASRQMDVFSQNLIKHAQKAAAKQAEVEVHDISLGYEDDVKFSLRGFLKFNSNLHPQGQLFMTATDMQWLLQKLEDYEIMTRERVLNSLSSQYSRHESDVGGGLSLRMGQGVTSMSGKTVGRTLPLPSQLEVMGVR